MNTQVEMEMDKVFEATSKVLLDGMKKFFAGQANNIFRIQKELIAEDEMLNFPLVIMTESGNSNYHGNDDGIPHFYWTVLVDGNEVEDFDGLVSLVTDYCAVEKDSLSEKSLALFKELDKALDVFAKINAGDSGSEVTYQYGKMSYDLGVFLNNQRYSIQG